MASKFDFDVQKEQSKVKTEIVTKFFAAWCRVMKNMRNVEKIGYIDLFSGPGIYNDGSISTPIIILKMILKDPILKNKVVTIFNEKEKDRFEALKSNIANIDNIEQLKFKPIIKNFEVNDETVEQFKNINMIPCFSFIDPTGYSGLSLDLLSSLGKDFGSDLIFFFNYNDINRGINNPKVKSHMESLFGEHVETIRKDLESITEPKIREEYLVDRMAHNLHNSDLKFVLPFRFVFEGRDRTSHYLIFASKHFRGYDIMKDIMWKAGEKDLDMVGKFEFIPSRNKENLQFTFIDKFNSSLEELKSRLLLQYKGKSGSVRLLYETDSVNTKYRKKDYKTVLKELEAEHKISCNPPASERRKNTMADDTVIKFI